MLFLHKCPEWLGDCRLDMEDLEDPQLFLNADAMRAFLNYRADRKEIDPATAYESAKVIDADE